jgi:glycosyltransferase involved in cell wall biosynthesis
MSLIVAVYDDIKALDLVLTALNTQTFKYFEVIIADDGSGEEMQKYIHSQTKKDRTYKLHHVFQEDKGFRKNKIMNEAVKKASTNYLVFIDGDCVPHSNFLKEHYENIKNNTVLCGKRVNLSKRLSDELTKIKILDGSFERVTFKHFYDSWRNRKIRSTYVEEGLIVKNKYLRKIFLKEDPHIVGCNFSLHKKLIEKVNGFDENYTGPGIGEDSDLEFRLRLINAEFYSLRNLAVLFHLHHKQTMGSKQNLHYFQEVQKLGEYRCRNGIVKLNSNEKAIV